MPFLPDINLSGKAEADKFDALVKQLNEWGRAISNENRTRIIKDDSGTPRLLEGFQKGGFSSGNVGIKMSQVGEDVTAATSDNLIFSSDFNNFKIVTVGTTTVAGTSTSGATTVTTTIAHNLGYQPAILMYSNAPALASMQGGNGILSLPLTYFQSGGTAILMVQARVDSTNIYIDFIKPLAGTTDLTGSTWTFIYYLLRETAS